LKAKGKSSKKEYLMSVSPQDALKEIRSYQIENSGLTAENIGNIKKEDKTQVDKVDKIEPLIEELIELKLATSEHQKMKAAIDKQRVA
jgi:hypothetical protein